METVRFGSERNNNTPSFIVEERGFSGFNIYRYWVNGGSFIKSLEGILHRTDPFRTIENSTDIFRR